MKIKLIIFVFILSILAGLEFFFNKEILSYSSVYLPHFQVFNLYIPTWFIFGWINIILGKTIIIYLGYKKEWDFSKWLTLILFSTLGASLGAILFSSVIGVLLGFIGFFFIGKKLLKFNHETGDILTIYIAIVLAIGRIGCLLNGCCFGSPTDSSFGISYPIGTPAHWLHLFSGTIDHTHSISAFIHPIQLYEIIFLLSFVVLIFKFNYKFRNKDTILSLFFGSYLIFRIFLEYIRDMNNIWWGEINVGPFTLLQWFLLVIGVGFIFFSIKLEARNKKYLKKKEEPIFIYNELILIGMTLLITTILKNQFQTIYLIQLSILIPFSILNYCYKLKNKFIFSPYPVYTIATIILLIFVTPIFGQIENRILNPTFFETFKKNHKSWIYIINENNNKLIRIGNEDLSYSEFKMKKENLNLFSNQSISDSLIFSEIKLAPISKIQYYGVLGLGSLSYSVEGCGGGTTTYQHSFNGFALGVEKKKEYNEYKNSYLGIRGNIFKSKWSSTNSLFNNSHLSNFSGLNIYNIYNFKWVGIGGGILSLKENNTDLIILPHIYFRIGKPAFFIETGFADRYVGGINPTSIHLNLGFGDTAKKHRFGVMTGLPNKPIASTGYFIQSQISSKSGYNIEPTFLLFNSGFSLNLKIGLTDKLID